MVRKSNNSDDIDILFEMYTLKFLFFIYIVLRYHFNHNVFQVDFTSQYSLSRLCRKQNRIRNHEVILNIHCCFLVDYELYLNYLIIICSLNLYTLQCIFVGCSHCDCVSGYTSVSGVYEITSPVTNNPILVECVKKKMDTAIK